jgi:hypothetical protein
MSEEKLLDRELAKDVLKNVLSALAIAAVFYLLVGVLGFRFPKGAGVGPASAIP